MMHACWFVAKFTLAFKCKSVTWVVYIYEWQYSINHIQKTFCGTGKVKVNFTKLRYIDTKNRLTSEMPELWTHGRNINSKKTVEQHLGICGLKLVRKERFYASKMCTYNVWQVVLANGIMCVCVYFT